MGPKFKPYHFDFAVWDDKTDFQSCWHAVGVGRG